MSHPTLPATMSLAAAAARRPDGPPAGLAAARMSPARRLGHPLGEDSDALARAAGLLAPPAGGPLGLHAAAAPAAPSALGAIDAARLTVGRTAHGHAEVRLDLGAALGGAEARLVAGPRGLELALVAPSEAARRLVEGKLVELARALEGRGLHVARCRAVTRAEAAREAREDRRG